MSVVINGNTIINGGTIVGRNPTTLPDYPDLSFKIGTGFNNTVYSFGIQSDGKILVGGAFTTYNGTTSNYIIRLNTDGSKDTSFNIGTGFNNDVFNVKPQSDGKILVGGNFTSYSGITSNGIIRLNTDGSKDTSFNIGTGFSGRTIGSSYLLSVRDIEIQSDGKILVGGIFGLYSGVTSNGIIRLNTDGSIDSSFNIGTGFDRQVFTLKYQSDGKILVGGAFLSYSGITSNRIIRLNTDGSVDSSFNIGTGFNLGTISGINTQTDGKIMVCGFFTAYNGVQAICLVRLNIDGSRDFSFIDGAFSSNLYQVVIDNKGKIIVTGNFTSYSGVTSNYIIRLNTDGSIDSSFSYYGSKFNNYTYAIALQNDNKILIGGGFTSYNNVFNSKVIRLIGD